MTEEKGVEKTSEQIDKPTEIKEEAPVSQPTNLEQSVSEQPQTPKSPLTLLEKYNPKQYSREEFYAYSIERCSPISTHDRDFDSGVHIHGLLEEIAKRFYLSDDPMGDLYYDKEGKLSVRKPRTHLENWELGKEALYQWTVKQTLPNNDLLSLDFSIHKTLEDYAQRLSRNRSEANEILLNLGLYDYAPFIDGPTCDWKLANRILANKIVPDGSEFTPIGKEPIKLKYQSTNFDLSEKKKQNRFPQVTLDNSVNCSYEKCNKEILEGFAERVIGGEYDNKYFCQHLCSVLESQRLGLETFITTPIRIIYNPKAA